MAQALEILIVTGFFLLGCFFVGKKWGERKYLKMKEELKAHELAFNQLLERMDLVATHNLKMLETKTEELRQLVPVVDKKLLFAGDLLQELDSAQKPSYFPTPVARTDSPVDLKFRREIQEIMAEMKERIFDLESRLADIDAAERKRLIHEIARPVPVSVKAAQDFAVDHPVRVSEKVFEKAGPERMAESRVPVTNSVVREIPRRLTSHSHLEGSPVRELRPPSPAPGTLHHDVIKMRKKGMALPQIARELKIGHGEVELIMNIYGGMEEPLRKVT